MALVQQKSKMIIWAIGWNKSEAPPPFCAMIGYGPDVTCALYSTDTVWQICVHCFVFLGGSQVPCACEMIVLCLGTTTADTEYFSGAPAFTHSQSGKKTDYMSNVPLGTHRLVEDGVLLKRQQPVGLHFLHHTNVSGKQTGDSDNVTNLILWCNIVRWAESSEHGQSSLSPGPKNERRKTQLWHLIDCRTALL